MADRLRGRNAHVNHGRRLALALALLLLGSMAAAHAQVGGGHGGRQKNQQQTPQPSSTVPSSVLDTQPWPRLEPGAVLCKSRDDLVRYQTRIAGGTSSATGEQGSSCSRIAKQVGIQILDRDGPSRSQIVTTGESKQTGWTNAYLPSTRPPSQ